MLINSVKGVVMTKLDRKKVLLIGLDGAIPGFVKKFSREGRLPTLTKLMNEGFFAESLPVPVCDTPTNWTTLLTGAWAGTHGVMSFWVHLPGEPLDQTHPTLNTKMCDVEHLWDVAEREGKKFIMLNWPVSWPPTTKGGIIIDGTGPGTPLWKISNSNVYATHPPEGKPRLQRGQESPLDLKPAEGPALRDSATRKWQNIPDSYSQPLEATIPLKGQVVYRWSEMGWQVQGMQKSSHDSIAYQLLIIDSNGKGYDKVIIAREKDAKNPVAVIEAGQWSEWVYEIFSKSALLTEESGIEGSEVEGVFRFKLVELSEDGKTCTLYRTDIWTTKGWSHPEHIAEEICREVRPFTEGMELPPGVATNRGHWDIYFEGLDSQVQWYIDSAEYLVNRYDDWDLLIAQIHVQDGINHAISPEVYPGYQNYDPDEADRCWELFAKSYEAVDRMVGQMLERCADESTLVAVVSDHGAIPIIKGVRLNAALARAGLMTYKESPNSRNLVIDWSKTKVFPRRTHIWVNRIGRDPDGIVTDAEYEKVRDLTIKTLYEMVDDETGECPVSLVIRKEDAEMMGLWGGKAGDLSYYLKPGYTDASGNYANAEPDLIKKSDIAPINPGCAHHQYLPTARLELFSTRGIMLFYGPGIKKGYERSTAVWTVDLTPTLAYYLGIPAPKQSEGKVIFDAFEGKKSD